MKGGVPVLSGMEEEICARLCLASHAAWNKELPAPLPRIAVHSLIARGALTGLVLREKSGVSAKTIDRARALLSRSEAVYGAVVRYEEMGYHVLIPGQEAWPRKLHALGNKMPLFLFAKGNLKLLERQLVAVAGSRSIADQTRTEAEKLGGRLACEGYTLVTGGAIGVDTAAQNGMFEMGGSAILIPAFPAEDMLRNPRTRSALDEGRLLLLCDTLPDKHFSAEKALARNHTIYALADAAIVAASRVGTGGSWRGAMDCMKGCWTPVFALEGDEADKAGNRDLRRHGARVLKMNDEKPLGVQLFA